MSGVDFYCNVKGIKGAEAFFKKYPDILAEIVKNSLNKAGQAYYKAARKMARNEWGLPYEALRGYRQKKAKKEYLKTMGFMPGEKIDVKYLNPTPNTPMTGKTTGGVTFTLFGERVNLPFAFYSHLPVRGAGVYRALKDKSTGKYARTEKGRAGKSYLTSINTLSFPQLLRSRLTNAPSMLSEITQKAYNEQFTLETNACLSLWGAK